MLSPRYKLVVDREHNACAHISFDVDAFANCLMNA